MGIYTFDPSQVSLSLAGYRLNDITKIRVSFTSKGFQFVRGIRGGGTRVRNADRGMTIEISVMQTSPTNNLLSDIHSQDLQYGTGRIDFYLKDNNSSADLGTVISSDSVYIEGYPEVSFSGDTEDRTWTLHGIKYSDVRVGSNFKNILDLF